MAIRKLLLLLKPLDPYPFLPPEGVSRIKNPQVLRYLESRHAVHKDAVKFCQEILRKKPVEWRPISRNDLLHPIHDVDMVITVGGDGTLLQASHFIDDSIPVLGVNSDPTQAEEVEAMSDQFDASRSTGHLCAATVENFEQILDDILFGRTIPSEVSRIAVKLNSKPLPTHALNDILIAHPCPATVSRFSFKIKGKDNNESWSKTVNCRSSGLRICTGAGSTAAMLSAGGFVMPVSSRDLQYMVREPISPGSSSASLMHGFIEPDQSMDVDWYSDHGSVYIDGCHIRYTMQLGDTVEISSDAPFLNVFLPPHALSGNRSRY
ncbi:PREDICTED: NADH kinase [Tarenaya hassleriana]|uniref:NADH kinase n=1 Tax=Tarenaya hassleriana TaxID=28532 RepID=UPI00053C2F52|nr:PREDICTED: NADH kinase [Tarenaya hassleriana]XP_010540141.1 PREDICTED: NADH kinase [Tarenaya hassleriana]